MFFFISSVKTTQISGSLSNHKSVADRGRLWLVKATHKYSLYTTTRTIIRLKRRTTEMLKLSNKTNNKIVFFDSQLEAKKWAMNNIKWIRHTQKRVHWEEVFRGRSGEHVNKEKHFFKLVKDETFLLWAFTYQYLSLLTKTLLGRNVKLKIPSLLHLLSFFHSRNHKN